MTDLTFAGSGALGLGIQWEREVPGLGDSVPVCGGGDTLDVSPDFMCPMLCCSDISVLLCRAINWDQQLLEEKRELAGNRQMWMKACGCILKTSGSLGRSRELTCGCRCGSFSF